VLRSPAFPTSQPSREILPIAGQQNKRAVAVTNRQWLARAGPPEFGSNHGLVWLMIGFQRPADLSARPSQVRCHFRRSPSNSRLCLLGRESQEGSNVLREGYATLGSRRSHHVHVTEPDGEMWRRLAFRDYLRAHPEEAQTYERLKRRLAAEHPTDRDAYTDAKSDYVETVMRKAIT
jgi:hypothetical protein